MLEQILKQGLFSPAGVRATQRVLDSNFFATGMMLAGNSVIAMAKYLQNQHKEAAQQQSVPQLTIKQGI